MNSCKYSRRQDEKFSTIPEGHQRIPNWVCELKEQDEAMKHQIHQMHFDMGLDGSFVSDKCPMAISGDYADCPYHKP